jgi:hypothetical protein
MTQEQARKLEQLHDMGYLIIIEAGSLVDSPVTGIWDADEDDADDEILVSEKIYSSETFSGRPLREVQLTEVKVYQPVIDWMTKTDLEQQPNDVEWDEMYENLENQ